MLAEEFGWSIEYIASLTHKQVRKIVEGKTELNALREGATSTLGKSNKRIEYTKGGKVVHENVSVNSFGQLLTLPGAGNAMTPRLREHLKKKRTAQTQKQAK